MGTTTSIHKRLPWPSLIPPPQKKNVPPHPAAQARRHLIPPKPLPERCQQLPYLLPHQPGQQGCRASKLFNQSPKVLSFARLAPWLGWEVSPVGEWSRVSWLFLRGGLCVCQGEGKLCLVYHQTAHLTYWTGCGCFHGNITVPHFLLLCGELHFKKEILR